MEKVTLYVEKCCQLQKTDLHRSDLFLDFVDAAEFAAFKNLCKIPPTVGNENCSMLCVRDTGIRLKDAVTFQVPLNQLIKFHWTSSNIGSVRYELDGKAENFESILPYRKPRW